MQHRYGRWLGAIVVGMGLSASPTDAAQLAQAELRGTVMDESGAALPGVAITAVSIDTGSSRSTTTAPTGTYVMPALPTGNYKVTAELSGFVTIVRDGFRLSVGESAQIDFTLKVATVAETITVTGESPLVDTKRSGLSGVINPDQVQQLPLNGRNWLDLVAMAPGARGNPGEIRAGASGGDGARYQMDGLSVTGQGTGSETQSYSQETIAEVEVLTNRYSAEYGRVTGAVVNAVSKSGTNNLRGVFYGYLRDKGLNAKDHVTNLVTPLHELQMGGTVGGPIVRDRVHFFGSYERQKREITNISTTGIPAFDVAVEAPITRDLYSARLDAQLSQNHRLFVRSNPYKELRIAEGIGGKVVASGGDDCHAFNIDGLVGETWVLSDRLLNEVRTGAFYFDKRLEELATTPRYSFPTVTIGPATNVPQWWRETIFQFNDSLSYFVPAWGGEHRFKAGFQYQHSTYQGELPARSYGNFTFDRDPANFNDMSTWPRPTQYSATLGDFSYNVKNPVYGFYAQDDWSVARRVTLNLGLRYDLEPKVDNPGLEEQAIEPGTRGSQKTNFAPRVGLTFDVRGDGKSVIRGGAGLYYGNVLLNIPMNEARSRNRQAPVTVLNPDLFDPLQGQSLEQLLTQPRNLTLLSNQYKAPQQEQYSLGYAQQMSNRYAFQADYVRSNGSNIQMSRNINFFEDPNLHVPRNPATFGRPYPQYLSITLYESTGKSQYDGLQLGFTSRRGKGWYDFNASYTLSHTQGHTDANRFGSVANPFDLDAEYSDTTADQRHRFLINGTVYMPFDILLSAVYFTGSPKPLNITTSLDPFRSGTGRWLDAQGNMLAKNGERALYSDHKVDLRIQKVFHIARLDAQALVDVFNLFDRANYGTYGTTFGTAQYLKPAFSSNTFYQPRMVQVGFRVTY